MLVAWPGLFQYVHVNMLQLCEKSVGLSVVDQAQRVIVVGTSSGSVILIREHC